MDIYIQYFTQFPLNDLLYFFHNFAARIVDIDFISNLRKYYVKPLSIVGEDKNEMIMFTVDIYYCIDSGSNCDKVEKISFQEMNVHFVKNNLHNVKQLHFFTKAKSLKV